MADGRPRRLRVGHAPRLARDCLVLPAIALARSDPRLQTGRRDPDFGQVRRPHGGDPAACRGGLLPCIPGRHRPRHLHGGQPHGRAILRSRDRRGADHPQPRLGRHRLDVVRHLGGRPDLHHLHRPLAADHGEHVAGSEGTRPRGDRDGPGLPGPSRDDDPPRGDPAARSLSAGCHAVRSLAGLEGHGDRGAAGSLQRDWLHDPLLVRDLLDGRRVRLDHRFYSRHAGARIWTPEASGDAGDRLAPRGGSLTMQISLRGIHKEFPRQNGGSMAVLRDVSLTVEAGEFCCVVGASGCGKSTILNILAGLLLPDAWQVLVDDATLHASRLRIGYVFQKPRLLNWKSVRDNVVFALRAAGVSADEARARALAIAPDLLLMDEPFSHLDEMTARTMRAELLRIWQQARTPVMFVTHKALEAVYLADKVLILSGRPATILKSVRVGLPRDREMEDPRLVQLQREILDTLGITAPNAVRH